MLVSLSSEDIGCGVDVVCPRVPCPVSRVRGRERQFGRSMALEVVKRRLRAKKKDPHNFNARPSSLSTPSSWVLSSKELLAVAVAEDGAAVTAVVTVVSASDGGRAVRARCWTWTTLSTWVRVCVVTVSPVLLGMISGSASSATADGLSGSAGGVAAETSGETAVAEEDAHAGADAGGDVCFVSCFVFLFACRCFGAAAAAASASAAASGSSCHAMRESIHGKRGAVSTLSRPSIHETACFTTEKSIQLATPTTAPSTNATATYW